LFDSAINVTPRSRDWTFSGKNFCQLFFNRLENGFDRQNLVADAEIFCERLGVAQTAFTRITCGHGNAEHLVRAERLRREHGHERGVNAAGQPDNHRFETAFVNVIANAQRQRGKQLLLARGPSGFRQRRTGIHVGNENVFGKSFAGCDGFPVAIESDTVAVENQFVVRADEIDLCQRHALVARDALQHGEPGFFLAVVPRRRGNVKDDFRALPDEFLDRVAAV
jgi:hypothetical protein